MVSEFSGGEEVRGGTFVFALPNLIFLRTKGHIWSMKTSGRAKRDAIDF